MNYNTLRIVALSMCLYAGHVYGMETEIELQKLPSPQDALELLEQMPKINHGELDTFDIEHAQHIKNQVLETQIRKRKFCNVLYGIITLIMMAADITNSYCDEKGLFKQQIDSFRPSETCECPNRTSSCKIARNEYWKDSCELTEDSKALYGINDSETVWRIYSGFMNLHYLYRVQQALNAQSIIEDNETFNEKDTSATWLWMQGISSGVIGTITSIAGVVNGLTNYPRTVAVWGMNAAVDALGALNWYENMKACQAVIEQNNNKLKDVIVHGKK